MGVPPGRGLRSYRKLRPHPRHCPPHNTPPPPRRPTLRALPRPGPSPALPGTAPAPNTLPALGVPDPPPSGPPHLKPPAPRWAPPCDNCPWRLRDGGAPGGRGDLDSSLRPAPRARARPHSRPRPACRATPSGRPPAPLRGRSAAGSVAAEGGAGAACEAVCALPVESRRFIARGRHRVPTTPTGRLNNHRPALSHLPPPSSHLTAIGPGASPLGVPVSAPALTSWETLGESLIWLSPSPGC